MATFSKAYNRTVINEGGYSNDPADAGGETWRGIARNKNPTWPGWAIVDFHRGNPHFEELLAADEKLDFLHRQFYKQLYWDRMRGDEINNELIAGDIFDTCILHGVKKAIVMAQNTLGVTETGVMDEVTIAKLNHT